MTELERFLREARPDCPHCGGTGLVPTESVPCSMGGWIILPDHFCNCVPLMIIRTADE